jgi:hypothetical protein
MSMASSSVNRSGTAFNTRSPKPAVFTSNAVQAIDSSPNLNQFTHPDTFKQEDEKKEDSLLSILDTIDLSTPCLGDLAPVGNTVYTPLNDAFDTFIRIKPSDLDDAADLTTLQMASNWAVRPQAGS